jgi:mannose-6-phosphate isomerase-like protein (cupin superfamily)
VSLAQTDKICTASVSLMGEPRALQSLFGLRTSFDIAQYEGSFTLLPMAISAETEYFAGKVRKQSLPVFEGSVPMDAPSLKRLLLPQGELTPIHESALAIHYIAFLELRQGTVRGNHYHNLKEEFFYLCRGECVLVCEDVLSKVRQSLALEAGDLVRISPGIAHALRVIHSGMGLEFSPARFNASDTLRYPLPG